MRACRVTCLPVGSDGRVDPDQLRDAITDAPCSSRVMAANNEVGVLQPIAEIGAIAHERGVADALRRGAGGRQGAVRRRGAAASISLSITAHKLYGPKGVGALYVRQAATRARSWRRMLDGGGHERGVRVRHAERPGDRRARKAAEMNAAEMPSDRAARRRCGIACYERLCARASRTSRLNGSLEHRLPHNLNVHFHGRLRRVAFSSASTTSRLVRVGVFLGHEEPPYVLMACGITDDLALSSIRFGLGRFTTEEEIDYAVEKVGAVIADLRRSEATAAGR